MFWLSWHLLTTEHISQTVLYQYYLRKICKYASFSLRNSIWNLGWFLSLLFCSLNRKMSCATAGPLSCVEPSCYISRLHHGFLEWNYERWLSHHITLFSWSWVWQCQTGLRCREVPRGQTTATSTTTMCVIFVLHFTMEFIRRFWRLLCELTVWVSTPHPRLTPSSLAEDKAMMCCLKFMITNY